MIQLFGMLLGTGEKAIPTSSLGQAVSQFQTEFNFF